MEWFYKLLDPDEWFFVSLLFALLSLIGSVAASVLFKKYWSLDRSRIVLKNIADVFNDSRYNNQCVDCNIDLKNDYYQVEFGSSAKPIDAITLKAPIANWNNGVVKVFLSDNGFKVSCNVNVLIYRNPTIDNGEIDYNGKKYIDMNNEDKDLKLSHYDLLCIKDGKDIVAAFIVFLQDFDDVNKINSVVVS